MDDNLTIVDALYHRAQTDSDRLAYVFLEDRCRRENEITYAQLLTNVQSVSHWLQKNSAQKDRVICLFETGPSFIFSFFGCLISKRIAVPLPPPRPAEEIVRIASIAEHSGSKIVLTTQEIFDRIAKVEANSKYIEKITFKIVDKLPFVKEDRLNVDIGDIAYLQYTSGTTGKPKGVEITHGNLTKNLLHIELSFGHTRESIGVIWLPPHHDMGLVGGILQPLHVGFPVYLMPPVDMLRKPLLWLQAISKYRATTSGGPNFSYQACVQRISETHRSQLDLSSWRVAFCGAEPISVDTLDRFSESFASCGFSKNSFTPCYGLAEATLMASCVELDSGVRYVNGHTIGRSNTEQKYVLCGRPVQDLTLKIVDPHSKVALLNGHPGEIWLKGENIAQGYWNNDHETKQTFYERLNDSTEGPFLRTGDIGALIDGELVICGRLKSVAVIRGVNHSLEDIEYTANFSHEFLQGFTCIAFVTIKDSIEQLSIVHEAPPKLRNSPTANAVVEAIRESVIKQHGVNPHEIFLGAVSTIPRTTSGKKRRDQAAIEKMEEVIRNRSD